MREPNLIATAGVRPKLLPHDPTTTPNVTRDLSRNDYVNRAWYVPTNARMARPERSRETRW